MLGAMYFRGEGIAENHNDAVKWLRTAAENGVAEAQVLLGRMYFRGEGVAQNHKEAIKWYRMAAKQGHEIKDAEAQHFLALPLSSDSVHFRPLSNFGGGDLAILVEGG